MAICRKQFFNLFKDQDYEFFNCFVKFPEYNYGVIILLIQQDKPKLRQNYHLFSAITHLKNFSIILFIINNFINQVYSISYLIFFYT